MHAKNLSGECEGMVESLENNVNFSKASENRSN